MFSFRLPIFISATYQNYSTSSPSNTISPSCENSTLFWQSHIRGEHYTKILTHSMDRWFPNILCMIWILLVRFLLSNGTEHTAVSNKLSLGIHEVSPCVCQLFTHSCQHGLCVKHVTHSPSRTNERGANVGRNTCHIMPIRRNDQWTESVG